MRNREKYFPPTHASGQFHCPYCGVFSKQRWAYLRAVTALGNHQIKRHMLSGSSMIQGDLDEKWTASFCEHCNGLGMWLSENLIFPKKIVVEQPNADLDEDIQNDYLEAAKVLSDSPRASAAILRLALQKLCRQLGEKGENINNDIGSLVKKGLNPTIQKSLDALRITGNNAVHPGELDLTEDKERVIKLFGLINFIAEKMITEPKAIDAFYSDLPTGATASVEKRDSL